MLNSINSATRTYSPLRRQQTAFKGNDEAKRKQKAVNNFLIDNIIPPYEASKALNKLNGSDGFKLGRIVQDEIHHSETPGRIKRNVQQLLNDTRPVDANSKDMNTVKDHVIYNLKTADEAAKALKKLNGPDAFKTGMMVEERMQNSERSSSIRARAIALTQTAKENE